MFCCLLLYLNLLFLNKVDKTLCFAVFYLCLGLLCLGRGSYNIEPHEAVPEVSKKYSIYKSEEQVPIEIVFDMLGFNMLNPKMKNHPPFVLPRLSNMQRSQHTKLLRRNKDSF